MACNSNTPSCRVERIESWDSAVVVICIWGTFNLSVFQVIWVSFSAFASKWPVTRKRVAVSECYQSLTAHQHQKGHTVPKQLGDNDCNVNSNHYSLSTALCESIRYQAKSEQNVRQDQDYHILSHCWTHSSTVLTTS